MKVTDIRSLSHKPGQYRIAVDGKPVGYISGEDLLQLKLTLNQSVPSQLYQQLLEAVKYNSFYSDARRYADRRLRSTAEIKRYLIDRGCEVSQAEQITQRLEGLGLIDERKLAAAYIHDTSIGHPRSSKELALKLKQKQLDPEIISSELISSGHSDAEALDQLLAKKSRLSAYANNQPKLFRYLLSKGFTYEDIAKRIGRPDTSAGSYRRRNRTGF